MIQKIAGTASAVLFSVGFVYGLLGENYEALCCLMLSMPLGFMALGDN